MNYYCQVSLTLLWNYPISLFILSQGQQVSQNRNINDAIIIISIYKFTLTLNKFINMDSPLKISGRYLSTTELSPKKDEWTLMNQYKLLQIQKQKQTQKMRNIQKKMNFREELNNQLIQKRHDQRQQKQKESQFYENLLKRNKQLVQQQENEKRNKKRKYKDFQQQNKYLRDATRNLKANNKDYFQESFQIGKNSKSPVRNQNSKRQLIDTLDKQVQQKAEQKERERKKNQELIQASLNFKMIGQRSRKPRSYSQNQNVYKEFSRINQQRQQKERKIEENYIQRPRYKMFQEQQRKREDRQKQKSLKKAEMKSILDHQVDDRRRKKFQEKRENYSQQSFSILNGMKKQKSPFDKQQYYHYLKKQADEQKERKKNTLHMNEQEYRMNLNQLNRVVSGGYIDSNYVNRSVHEIGQKNAYNKPIVLQNEDSQKIKNNIIHIKDNPHKLLQEKYIY